jgi:hypothetical protein
VRPCWTPAIAATTRPVAAWAWGRSRAEVDKVMPPRKRKRATDPASDAPAEAVDGCRKQGPPVLPVLVPCECDPKCEQWSLHLRKPRAEGLFIDATLAVGSRLIKAHRVVLAVHSSFLKALFTSGLSESAAASPLPVALDDEAMDAGAVAAIVDCFYTGTIALTGANVCAIIRTANLLCVDTIERAACGFFVDRLEPATALDALRFARQLSEGGVEGRQLHTSVLKYVHQHFAECATGAPFLELSAASLAELLRSDELRLQSEDDALGALRTWFEHDAAARQSSLDELVPLIRFPQLPVAAQLQLRSHPLLQELAPSLVMQLLIECHPAFAASAEADSCPRLRQRGCTGPVASEVELVAAVAKGGRVLVKAGVTIVLSKPLNVTVDCDIAGERGGEPPVLRGGLMWCLICSLKGKSLRLARLRLNAGIEGGNFAVYGSRGGRFEVSECDVTASTYGVFVAGGCEARIVGTTVRGCHYGLSAVGSATRLVADGVTVQDCKSGVAARTEARVELQGCALRNNLCDTKQKSGGRIVEK